MLRVSISVKKNVAKLLGRTIAARTQKLSALVTQAWRMGVDESQLSGRAKDRYKKAITPYKSKAGAYVRDFVASLLETGWRRFDMKPGLLRGAAYRVIPIGGGTGTPTFRAVSTRSSASSWIHPGFHGAKAMEKVSERLQALIREATDG